MEKLLTSKEFRQIVGISYSTFKEWVREGKVKVIRTTTGRIRVPYSEVERILGVKAASNKAVIYARVSSRDRRRDLERQIERLREYAKIKGYEVLDVIADISSGLSAKRKGLQKLFEYVTSREIGVVLITYKDRLTRFGFEYLEYFFSKYNVKIEAIEGEGQKDSREEIEDLMRIITMFSHGKKREKIIAEIKRAIEAAENERE